MVFKENTVIYHVIYNVSPVIDTMECVIVALTAGMGIPVASLVPLIVPDVINRQENVVRVSTAGMD